jgi:hypothetical protein
MKEYRGSSIDRAPLNPTSPKMAKKSPPPPPSPSSKKPSTKSSSKNKLGKPITKGAALSGCRTRSVLVKVLLDHFEETMPDVVMDQRVQDFFGRLDVSKDGNLSKEELSDGIRRILNIGDDKLSDEEIDAVFNEMKDKDEDFVNYVAFEGFIEGGGSNSNYRGYFLDCEKGLDGKIYSAERIWCTDVAAKWIKKSRGEDGGPPLTPSPYHQRILRSCNLQSVISAALSMEADIAFTGSRCTVGLKVESQRRLSMVKSAALVLAKHFVTEDEVNQEVMFK